MTIVEHEGDLCDASQAAKFHAIALDARCGVGVAKDIVDAVGERPKVPKDAEIGTIVKQDAGDLGVVYHVTVKQRSPDKFHKDPEAYLRGVHKGFKAVADIIRDEKLEEVALSYMCSGTDKLHRLWTMDLLYQELKDVPVTLHYYGKYYSARWEGAGELFVPVQEEEEAEEEREENEAPLDPKKKPGRPNRKNQGKNTK